MYSRIIGLDMNLGDVTIVQLQDIALAPLAAKDGRCIKVELQCLRETARWIAKKANLSQVKSACLP